MDSAPKSASRTSDYGEAVLNATKVIEHPFLNESARLEHEVEAFLTHKTRQNEYSAGSAESKDIRSMSSPSSLASAELRTSPPQTLTSSIELCSSA